MDDYGYRPIGETKAAVLEALAEGRGLAAGALALKTRQELQITRNKIYLLHRYHLVRPSAVGWEITLEGRKALAAHVAAKKAWEATK